MHQYPKDVALKRRFAAIFRLIEKYALQSCLVRDSLCKGGVIRAHSVQSSRVLEAVAHQGHVYMFQPQAGSYPLTLVGKNKATTFTGFCNHHDTVLFRDIDFGDARTFDPNNRRQHLLLSLRAAAREYWSKLNTSQWFDQIARRVRSGDIAGLRTTLNIDEPTAREYLQSTDMFSVYLKGMDSSSARMKRIFWSLYSQTQKDNSHLTHVKIFQLPRDPNLAVSACLTPWFDFEGQRIQDHRVSTDLADVALNIFPLQNVMWALFAFHRRFADRLSNLFRQLDEMSESERAVALSKIVIMFSENCTFSPRYVDRLSPDTRKEMEIFFRRTINDALSYSELPEFNFFSEIRDPTE